MANVIIYTKAVCPYCNWAKQLLDHKKVSYQEVRVDIDDAKRAEMEKISGRRTVPQIVINDQPIGGFDDLSTLEKEGKLDLLLHQQGK